MKILLRILLAAVILPLLAELFSGIHAATAEETSKGGQWQQIWSDEFDGDALDQSVWSYDIGSNKWGNNEPEYYTMGGNLSFEDGCLVITAECDPDGGQKKYTSSRINTKFKKQFRYGRIEAKMKLPSGQGIWPAFWMMGSGGGYFWPYCGEIDIMEGINACDVCYGTVHWGVPDSGREWPNNYKLFSFGAQTENPDPDQWHVYAIEWNADEIRWYCDDVCYHSFRIGQSDSARAIFREPFYLILNLAVGGNWAGDPNDSIFPQRMYVDYVRVYTWKE